MGTATREIVVPGQHLDLRGLKAGQGTYVEGGQAYAGRLGVRTERSGYLDIIPLGGRYIPHPDDLVVGVVEDIGPSFWLVELNGPYPAPLHGDESPWRVDFGDTARYLNVGDAIVCRVLSVDETKRVQVTMSDRESRKLTGGQLIEISHVKVPRVIGKKGSMVGMIKQYTRCQIVVGQNGRIWLDGDVRDIAVAAAAIRRIEEEAHTLGLTDAIRAMLESAYKKS